MKHKLVRHGDSRAYCSHPGCQSGVETGWFNKLSQEFLDSMEGVDGDCPFVSVPGNQSATQEERVHYLIKYAKKEIKGWKKIIDFWERNGK